MKEGKKRRGFLDDFELYIGSIFLMVTVVSVIVNVITRYFFKFTVYWSEEVAVGSFVWVIFLGFANSFRTHGLLGISAIVDLLPKKARAIADIITSLLVLIVAGLMLYFGTTYVVNTTKITAAMEISYRYIYSSIVIAFALVVIYAIMRIFHDFKALSRGEAVDVDPTLEERVDI